VERLNVDYRAAADLARTFAPGVPARSVANRAFHDPHIEAERPGLGTAAR
jgi:hypothetical protein